MEAEEVEQRVKRADRLNWYAEKAPFGWFECLRQIRGMLTDSVWEGDELGVACEKYFRLSEAQLRELAGLAPAAQVTAKEMLGQSKEFVRRAQSAQTETDQILAEHKKKAKALRQQRWREKKKGAV